MLQAGPARVKQRTRPARKLARLLVVEHRERLPLLAADVDHVSLGGRNHVKRRRGRVGKHKAPRGCGGVGVVVAHVNRDVAILVQVDGADHRAGAVGGSHTADSVLLREPVPDGSQRVAAVEAGQLEAAAGHGLILEVDQRRFETAACAIALVGADKVEVRPGGTSWYGDAAIGVYGIRCAEGVVGILGDGSGIVHVAVAS